MKIILVMLAKEIQGLLYSHRLGKDKRDSQPAVNGMRR